MFRIALTAWLTLLSLALPAKAQSLDALKTLSDTIWALSLSASTDVQAFEETVREAYPGAMFDHSLATEPAKTRWPHDVSYRWHARLAEFSRFDSITCLRLPAARVARLKSTADLQNDLRPFLFLADLVPARAISVQVCTGAYHPGTDRADYEAWHLWYDGLEAQFQKMGLKTSRSEPMPPASVTGFLSGQGDVCSANGCLFAASLSAVALPSLSTNQTVIRVATYR